MIESDKRAFAEMVKAIYIIYSKPQPEKEMLRIWWHKLERFDFNVVGKAFDTWIDKPNRIPQPADIIALCKPAEPVYLALPAPVSYIENKQHIDKLNNFISERLKPKTDYRAWAKRILRNPQNFPESSVVAAEQFA